MIELRNVPTLTASDGSRRGLLEIELPVVVHLGSARLSLAEVLDLENGSIVELDRRAEDPVEVFVNGCLVGRGQLVVVEGYYGVQLDSSVNGEIPDQEPEADRQAVGAAS